MSKIFNCALEDNFLDNLTNFVFSNYIKNNEKIEKIAFIFEGKRPELFFKKKILKKIGKSFFSPKFFSINEFVEYSLLKSFSFTDISDMEAFHILFQLINKHNFITLKQYKNFALFLPWAKEISKFINILDFEYIKIKEFKNTINNLPENISKLLIDIIDLREIYHKQLLEQKTLTKALQYYKTSNIIEKFDYSEFSIMIFCGFSYMQKSCKNIIQTLYNKNNIILFLQQENKNNNIFEQTNNSLFSNQTIDLTKKNPNFLKLYSAFDIHSQVCTIREIVKEINDITSTAIILLNADNAIALITELGSFFKEFNITLGYPLKRSSVYSILELIFIAQKTYKNNKYIIKDYISVIKHPIIKNLHISNSNIIEIIVEKIEKAFLGEFSSSITQQEIILLETIEQEENLINEIYINIEKIIEKKEIIHIIQQLHFYVFTLWEEMSNFYEFFNKLENFLKKIETNAFITQYPLNLKTIERLYSIKNEFIESSFKNEYFEKKDIFKIFQNTIEKEMLPFNTSPFKGIQILGLLETRALNFNNLIIMDANENIFPTKISKERLIPYDILQNLNIDISRKEENIQKYLFYRLIANANNVHIIYEENNEKEKSRFVEQLIWQYQKQKTHLTSIDIKKVGFNSKFITNKNTIPKNNKIINFLKDFSYSISSINTYMSCPIQFYYKYILKLKEKTNFIEQIDNKEIGIFIHNLLEETFKQFINKKPIINIQFEQYFFDTFKTKFDQQFTKKKQTNMFLLYKLMKLRLKAFLDLEKTRLNNINTNVSENNINKHKQDTIKKILYLEKKFIEQITIENNIYNFQYIVDRVDLMDSKNIIIIDYKTGSEILTPKSLEKLRKLKFNRIDIRDTIKSFQLPIYYFFEQKRYNNTTIKATLYNLRTLDLHFFPSYSTPEIEINETIDICIKALNFIITEINNINIDFIKDNENTYYCKSCPFYEYCE